MSTEPNAVILSGAGRFADPWHPFAETSERIAGILASIGFRVEITEKVDDRMSDLSDADLVVVNIGAPAEPDERADVAARAGLLAYLARGGAVLAMHSAATSLSGIPEWEQILGGLWVRGTTMHPELGRAHITIDPDWHPIVATLHDIELEDERYSYLRLAPDAVALVKHTHDGVQHSLAWAHNFGASRVAYDGLGHNARSYDSPEHRELVARAARWLTGRLD